MAWTAPMTWVAGAAITAAQLNAHLRDNMLESSAAKTTVAGSYMAGTGSNSIAERTLNHQFISTSETTTLTGFDDLPSGTVGPTNTNVPSAAKVLVLISCTASNSTAGATCNMGIDVSGSLTSGAFSGAAIRVSPSASNVPFAGSYVTLYNTAGTSTYTAKYSVSGGTGSFYNRRLMTLPL